MFIDIQVRLINICNEYKYTNKKICFTDEDAQLLNEVTTRMAMDNIKTNRTVNDSRIRGYET